MSISGLVNLDELVPCIRVHFYSLTCRPARVVDPTVVSVRPTPKTAVERLAEELGRQPAFPNSNISMTVDEFFNWRK